MPDDLPAPLTTRNLLPRSPATSLSLSAAASRSHSPTPSSSRQPQDTDLESQSRSFSSMDHSDAWASPYSPFITNWSGISLNPPELWGTDTSFTDSSIMNPTHHTASSSTDATIENDPFPRRAGKKQLFADNPMHAGPSQPGPSSQPFYNPAQPSESTPSYRFDNRTMSGLKRKREEPLDQIQPWLDHQNPHPMSISVDDPIPGPSYVSQDRKGKGKEIDYKGKGKQREEPPDDSPILISDSPIISNVKPLATTTLVPSKPLSEPLSSYTCPICFSAPTNATLTPCGHICCGECLFTAVKTVMHRAQQAGAPDAQEARCPVCRALIPDWDGKGAGVIGLKIRAIFSL